MQRTTSQPSPMISFQAIERDLHRGQALQYEAVRGMAASVWRQVSTALDIGSRHRRQG